MAISLVILVRYVIPVTVIPVVHCNSKIYKYSEVPDKSTDTVEKIPKYLVLHIQEF